MLGSSLPFYVWGAILGFLQVSDLYGLLTTNKDVRSIVDQESVYEQLAKRKFPSHLISRNVYPSWKALVQDDNAENGFYRLQSNGISYHSWRNNDPDGGMYHVKRIRAIIWDRLESEIIFEIEVFGENGLRHGVFTSIRRFNPAIRVVTQLPCILRGLQKYEHNSTSHQLFRIPHDAAYFRPQHAYRLTTHNETNNFNCATFLASSQVPSLPKLFDFETQQQQRQSPALTKLEEAACEDQKNSNNNFDAHDWDENEIFGFIEASPFLQLKLGRFASLCRARHHSYLRIFWTGRASRFLQISWSGIVVGNGELLDCPKIRCWGEDPPGSASLMLH
jgi:hypothetical protein